MLQLAPIPFKECPNCNTAFVGMMRGCVQRSKRKWWFLQKQPYCAIICYNCKEIVGWENPPVNITDIILTEIKEELKKAGIHSYFTHMRTANKESMQQLNIKIKDGWFCIDQKEHGNKEITLTYDCKSAAINMSLINFDTEITKLKDASTWVLSNPSWLCLPSWQIFHYDMMLASSIDDAINDIISIYNLTRPHWWSRRKKRRIDVRVKQSI